MNRMKIAAIALVAAASAGTLMPASAAKVPRAYLINAAGNCNGALPVFEMSLRKRPTAIANEGNALAFVTCSLPGDFQNAGTSLLFVGFTNSNPGPVTFDCTFVDGQASGFSGARYYPKSITLQAAGPGFTQWVPAEEGQQIFRNYPNLSCALPAGVEINSVQSYYDEDNGVAAAG